jgi:hypothetical protein
MIEQSHLEKKLQNKLRIEDLKIVFGQLESQEFPVYYMILVYEVVYEVGFGRLYLFT